MFLVDFNLSKDQDKKIQQLKLLEIIMKLLNAIGVDIHQKDM
jgi:hypothetical protein